MIDVTAISALTHRSPKTHSFHSFSGEPGQSAFPDQLCIPNIDNFRPVYDWFKDTLVLVAPDSRFGSFEFFDEGHSLYTAMNEMLPWLDTGIAHLDSEEIH